MNYLAKYVLRRLGTAIVVLLGVSLITFILTHSVSSNPLTAWFGRGVSFDPKLVQIYTKEFHLNDPLYIQYFYYLVGVLHGYLGFSPTKGENVSTAITQTLPYSLQLILLSLIFTVLLGIATGLMSARFVHRTPDKILRALYVIGFASPPFFTALAVILFFTLVFPILPTSGGISFSVTPPPLITGIPIIDALITGNWAAFNSLLDHALLPALANALAVFGILTRVLRSSLLDNLNSNFVTAAKARGISPSRIFYFYAFKNSLVTVITIVALLFTFILGSLIFVEYIFSYPGIGDYLVLAVNNLDYASILAITLLFAAMIVLVNLVADILYTVVDPRIRYR